MKALPENHEAAAKEIERRARLYSLTRRALVLVTSLSVALVLGATLYIVILLRQQQVVNTTTSDNTGQLLTILTDCLTPGGACFKQSEDNQHAIILQAGRIYIYAGLCLSNPDIPNNTPAQENCVAQMIKEHGLGRSR